MLMHQTEEDELSDVLLRLLLNLTSPTLLLYNEVLPKDGPNRRNFLQLVEILQSYKAAFSLPPVWLALCKRLKHVLEIVSANSHHFHFGLARSNQRVSFTCLRFMSIILNSTMELSELRCDWKLFYADAPLLHEGRKAASKRKTSLSSVI